MQKVLNPSSSDQLRLERVALAFNGQTSAQITKSAIEVLEISAMGKL